VSGTSTAWDRSPDTLRCHPQAATGRVALSGSGQQNHTLTGSSIASPAALHETSMSLCYNEGMAHRGAMPPMNAQGVLLSEAVQDRRFSPCRPERKSCVRPAWSTANARLWSIWTLPPPCLSCETSVSATGPIIHSYARRRAARCTHRPIERRWIKTRRHRLGPRPSLERTVYQGPPQGRRRHR
jgi:hypothetical protein